MDHRNHIWETITGGPADKLVAAILADHADNDGNCWPSVARIAKRAELSERGVRKCLRRLEERGIISRKESAAKKGCNLYTVNLNTPEPRSPLNNVQPEPRSVDPGTMFPLPLNHVPQTPEPRSAESVLNHHRTIIEPPKTAKVEKNERMPIQVDSMPTGFDHLKDDFNQWLKGRGTGAKKATPRAVQLAIKKMQKWGPDKARFILESAIIGNWQGLEDYGTYKPGMDSNAPPPNSTIPRPSDAEIDRMNEESAREAHQQMARTLAEMAAKAAKMRAANATR